MKVDWHSRLLATVCRQPGGTDLIAAEGDQPFTIRIGPARLIDAVWQCFARGSPA
jgi:hypothetical protein